MESTVFFEKIPMGAPRDKIYHRLGYKKLTTEISALQQKETDALIHEASSLIALQGMSLRLKISQNDGETISVSGNLMFRSKKLSAFLRNCREVILMGATSGSAIMEAIRDKTGRNDLTAAVVYDATASEMTDGALEWIMQYMNQALRREGKTLLPRRFSAGYADFALENQKIIYEKLQMDKFGVQINPSYILIPEKSVTAITGIY